MLRIRRGASKKREFVWGVRERVILKILQGETTTRLEENAYLENHARETESRLSAGTLERSALRSMRKISFFDAFWAE